VEPVIQTAPAASVTDPVAEAVRRLRASLQAERIYLFGSQARDEADEDSDYDFLVVVRESPLPRYKREQQAFRALCGMGIAKDVVVFTREEFEPGLAVASSLPATVAREGRLLYG
jgi:predicted nucleotidyltransferase